MIARRFWPLAALALLGACTGGSQAPHDTQPSVEVTTVKPGVYAERITAVGRIGDPGGTEAKLAFAEPGILRSVLVHIGARVSAGEPLAQLDTGGLSLSASQAQADARAAAANAQQSAVDRTSTRIAVDEAALRRQQALYAAGVAALKDVQAAHAQVAQDRADAASAHAQVFGTSAQLQSAEDRAALAQRDLANGTLRAPADGVVTAIFKREGEAVDTSTPVIGLGAASTGTVTLAVPASDAARVHVGSAVELSIPGTSLHGNGRVSGVSPAVDAATQTATVVVAGIPSGAPAGSAVQAMVDIARAHGIVIPQSAVVQDPQSGATLVFVRTRAQNGEVRFTQRDVRVDKQNGGQALIGSGLHPGEVIATQGAFALLAPAGGG
ncbi:MAG: efflux RND transporter periplasmic adaptor subunit [Candidatus Baltobacteraceae bacterium]